MENSSSRPIFHPIGNKSFPKTSRELSSPIYSLSILIISDESNYSRYYLDKISRKVNYCFDLKIFSKLVTGLRYSTRSASSGEIELARSAGIKDATSADNPSVTRADNVTRGLYGFMP